MFLYLDGSRAELRMFFTYRKEIDGVEVMLSWCNLCALDSQDFCTCSYGRGCVSFTYYVSVSSETFDLHTCQKFVYKTYFERWFEADLVLNIFLFLREFEAHVLIKLFLQKRVYSMLLRGNVRGYSRLQINRPKITWKKNPIINSFIPFFSPFYCTCREEFLSHFRRARSQ